MNHKNVMASANPFAILIITCVGSLIFALSVIGFLSGGFENSIYRGVFGNLILLIMFVGLSYFIYENVSIFINRDKFITINGEYLNIFFHGNIKLCDIKNVSIKRGFIVTNMVISCKNRSPINVRSYLLKERPQDVADKINGALKKIA